MASRESELAPFSSSVLPATARIDGRETCDALRLTSDIRPPFPGAAPEELGKLCCGPDSGLLWSASARQVLGAEASGRFLRVHVVATFRPESKAVEVSADDRSALPAGHWHLPAERRMREVELGDESTASMWAASITKWAYSSSRQLHVIINPFSGTGRGRHIWETVVKPVLELSPHEIVEHFTDGPGDATRYCKDLVMKPGSVVAAIGGDGSMSEVLNGLLSRRDARRGAFSICFIPGGTSNAMAHLCGCGDALTAAWALAKGRQQSLDIFELHQGTFHADGSFAPAGGAGPRYGFLSLTGGLVADIDIDSELFRCCGETRYVAYALLKVFCCCGVMKCFSKVHSRLRYRYRIRWLPKARANVDVEKALVNTRVPSGPRVNINDPGWDSWEGQLTFFGAYSAPAINRTGHYARGTRLNDGSLNLQWKTPSSRIGLVKQFDMMDTGAHIQSADGRRIVAPTWQQEDVVAVVVDKLESDSKVVLDGEALAEGTSWCATVLPRHVSVIVGSGPLIAFYGAGSDN